MDSLPPKKALLAQRITSAANEGSLPTSSAMLETSESGSRNSFMARARISGAGLNFSIRAMARTNRSWLVVFMRNEKAVVGMIGFD